MTQSIRKAIYPGSFDPITNGHIDIIHRAKHLFDHVTIAVINNPEKTPFFSLEERLRLIQNLFKEDSNIQVEFFNGLLVDFAKQKDCHTIVRGLRALSDFDFEFQMSLTNRKLYEKIDTVFLMTDQKYSYLSSSVVKQVAQFGGDITSLVPGSVSQAIYEKSQEKSEEKPV